MDNYEKINKKVMKFKKNIEKLMFFEDYEREILRASCESLKLYYSACFTLKKEGQIVKTKNGIIRKHPAVEIVKTNWANFLAGLRQLRISQTQVLINREQPQKPGRKLKGI
ncbi:MAG: P27 family phage terminase small subunit [Candidatus Odinarchaeota archaeon]